MQKFILIICFFLSFSSLAQTSEQASYLKGKELYKSGKYQEAMQTLQPLTSLGTGNAYTPYACFFYSLSAYGAGQLGTAEAMMLQIATKFPTWEKLAEVNFWRSRFYLDGKEYYTAFDLLGTIKDNSLANDIMGMKQYYLAQESSIATLQRLFDKYSYDQQIAEALAQKLSQSSREPDHNQEMLDFLVNEFDLDLDLLKTNVQVALPVLKKEEYRVAVFLPFMLPNDINSATINRSGHFVLDIYQGLKLAVEKLKADGINIKLYAYDTQRDAARTQQLLNTEEMKSIDLIIGPLYPGPSKVVYDYCLANKLNMVNPLSNNSQIISGNPYSFLIRPSAELMATKAAEFAKKKFKNKTAMVFYGTTTRDSIMAATYTQLLKEDSFKIVINKSVNAKSSREILNILTRSDFRKELNEDGDTIKVRSPWTNKVNVDVMDILNIKPDSIGHIFVVGSEQLIASNTISGVDTRADKNPIPVIALDDWLDYETMSFEQLERLGVHFIAPEFIDYSSDRMADFKDLFIERTATLTNAHSVLAYDMMLYLGRMLHKYGKYFQTGFDQGFVRGEFSKGYQFDSLQCNLVVPIIKFQNAELVEVKE